jgi:Holliday junction DNA helicase RuvB
LRDRFGYVARLDYYPPEDLVEILHRSAARLGVELESEASGEIARRSRGTPRIALRLLRRVRDFAEVDASRGGARPAARAGRTPPPARVTRAVARHALERLEVDEAGFDRLDQAFLRTLLEKFDGGPVGVESLAASLGEDRGTLEDLVEPFLIQAGFLDRTPRGRLATARARAHFGLPPAAGPGQRRLL